MSSLPWPLRAELQQQSLSLRWMDEVIHIWRNTFSRRGKRVLDRLASPNMYSDALLLLVPGALQIAGFTGWTVAVFWM